MPMVWVLWSMPEVYQKVWYRVYLLLLNINYRRVYSSCVSEVLESISQSNVSVVVLTSLTRYSSLLAKT
jgi:hypothetical protein